MKIGAYVGREAQPGLTELGGLRCNPDYPPEEPAEGCPGGWKMNRFAWSLFPYLRIRAEGGQRVSNRNFDGCTDPLVWACVGYYELEQERCEKHQAWLRRKALERDRGST